MNTAGIQKGCGERQGQTQDHLLAVRVLTETGIGNFIGEVEYATYTDGIFFELVK